MSLDFEINSRVGVSKHNLQYGDCRKWLTPIMAYATIHPDENKPPIQIGEALGFIIRRFKIQSDFYQEMETFHKGLMDLALGVFDRYGRVKEEIYDHALRKGSGVWSKELGKGNIVLIEDVKVESSYRRKRIGSKLVMHILEEALKSRYHVDFAFAAPAAYYRDDEEEGSVGPTSHDIKVKRITSFFRSLRFRRIGLTSWLALARNSEHPSRRLTLREDPDPIVEMNDLIDSDSEEEIILCRSDLTQTRLTKSEWEARYLGVSPKQKPAITTRSRPLHYAVKTLQDNEALSFLMSHTRGGELEQFALDALDGRGDSVLHVAAKASKPQCVAWLLQEPAMAIFSQANYAGYMPLEALKAQMETCRVRMPHGASRARLMPDKFNGFDKDSVMCLLLLEGVNQPSPEQHMRAKFGCSCNDCIEGFLSPRMLLRLAHVAQVQALFLTDLVPPGKNWYGEHQHLLKYLPQELKSRFRTSKALQKAFVYLMVATADCFSRGQIPRKATVVQRLRALKTWELTESQYFAHYGTVAAVVRTISDHAKLFDPEIGDSVIDETPEEYYAGLPRCRNDLEYEFVGRHCVDDAILDEEQESAKEFPVPMPWLTRMMRLSLEGKNLSDYVDV